MIDYFSKNKLSNALNIPISDPALLSKLSSYYELADLMGSLQSQLVGGPIERAEVFCYGEAEDSKSIALSFLKGVLSNITDNRVNFLNANSIANERGIIYSHSYSTDKIPYTNKIQTIVYSNGKNFSISGSVFGDNFIRITEIMGFEVDLKPEGRMLFIKNKDVPGVIGRVGTILGEKDINISGYLLSKVEDKDLPL
jgi:D-3-phosphoglycerate dehydrogenase